MAWPAFRRRAARVVLLNRRGEVLLLSARDPARPDQPGWWEIPGGGIDGDETSDAAARRELREETGITEVEMGPCVWTQHAVFTFGGYHFDQHERIHVAWCDDVSPVRSATRWEALEALAFGDHRWWSVDELLGSTERVLPHRLREFLPDVVAGRLPVEPHDITHAAGWA